jgi:hypothetical protein
LVPNVEGLSKSDARNVLSAVGLETGAVGREPSATVPVDHVITQDPAHETESEPGSLVNLVISSGKDAPNASDLNADGCVDRADYNIIMADIRGSAPHDSAHDLNGDGDVNRADARTLIGNCTMPRCVACNARPIANAGPDRVLAESVTVDLDGSGSSDPDKDPLTYRWLIISKPAESGASLSDAFVLKPDFPADVPGTYVVRLIVNDGFQDSLPDIAIINFGDDTVEIDSAWRREGYDIGATARYPFSSEPNDGSLTLLWQECGMLRRAVTTATCRS